jgi:bacteriochlorophyll A protein
MPTFLEGRAEQGRGLANWVCRYDDDWWANINVQAILGCPTAVPKYPLELEVEFRARPKGADISDITVRVESLVEGVKKGLEINALITDLDDKTRESKGYGRVIVGDFIHPFEWRGTVRRETYVPDSSLNLTRSQTYIGGRLFHDVTARIALDTQIAREAWDQVRTVTARNSEVLTKTVFFGPLWRTGDLCGQLYEDIQVRTLSASEGKTLSRVTFVTSGTGQVDSITYWTRLFPVLLLKGREAYVKGKFQTTADSIRVEAKAELPSVVERKDGVLKVIDHPQIPILHHGIPAQPIPLDLEFNYNLGTPNGWRIKEAQPTFRKKTGRNNYLFQGGSYLSFVNTIARGNITPFDVWFEPEDSGASLGPNAAIALK